MCIVTLPEEKPKIVFSPRRKKDSFVDFCYMSTNDIFDKFSGLPNAEVIFDKTDKNRRFLYVPATRPDPVLLVSHCDTVWGEDPIKLSYSEGKFFSAIKGRGIGADDRAGVAMLWKLRNLGHAILIPDGEESGCRGSRFLMEDEKWRKIINSHHFAIEMDRMNAYDLVFYRVGTPKFREWCEQQFTGYKTAHGTYTDICVLCDDTKHKEECLPGLNISVGYYGQHGPGEHLIDKEWQRTLSKLHFVLKQKDLPKFRQKHYPPYTGSTHNSYYQHHQSNPYDIEDHEFRNSGYGGMSSADEASMVQGQSSSKHQDSIVVCPHCDGIMDEAEWVLTANRCMYCKKAF